MKLLSVAIPCYNSAAYMRKCIESLLSGGEDVEILVVNDGSTDETAGTARRSTRASGRPRVCILRWWTAMTG